MTIYERPQGMSQLDWLVTTFGEYQIAQNLSDVKGIVTTDILKGIVLDNGGVIRLTAAEDNDGKITIAGYDAKNEKLTTVSFNKSKITDFEIYQLTKIEEDKGIGQVGDMCYRISLSDGQCLYAPAYTGADSNTIITEVLENKISSSLKIANPVQDKSVKLTATEKGVRADLIIDDKAESNIEIVVDKGVSAKLKWLDSEDLVGFKEISYNELQLINPRNGIIYFCPDQHKIVLNGKVYPLATTVDIDEINSKIDALNKRITDLIGLAPDELDTLEEIVDEIKKGDERYQHKGDYIEYVVEENGRKHIILANNDSIAGTLQDGSDGRNLIMLSKWDVVDVGSNKVPINLNGSKSRPTYNDDKDLALMEDINNPDNFWTEF